MDLLKNNSTGNNKPLPSLTELLQKGNSMEASTSSVMHSLADLLNSSSSSSILLPSSSSSKTSMKPASFEQQPNIPSLTELLKKNTLSTPPASPLKDSTKTRSTLPSLADLLDSANTNASTNATTQRSNMCSKSNSSQLPSLSLLSLSLNDPKRCGNERSSASALTFESLSLKQLADQHEKQTKAKIRMTLEPGNTTGTISMTTATTTKLVRKHANGLKRKPSNFAKILQTSFVIDIPERMQPCFDLSESEDGCDTIYFTDAMLNGRQPYNFSDPSPDDLTMQKQNKPYQRR